MASVAARVSLASMALVVTAAACAASPAAQPSTPAAASPASPQAHTVTAVVLVNGCAHFGVENARLAQAAMNALVDGCSAFAGERVQFTATLLPGGSIQFDPGAGDSKSIPVCVLSHPLTHRVQLQKACSLEVRLEQTSVAVPKSGDAGP
jgi:hypothetical protein